MLAGWVLASSVCALKLAGWVILVVSMSRNPTVYTLYRCLRHEFTHLQKHPPQGVHVRSCMRSLFSSIGGRGWGGSASLCSALVAGVGPILFFDMRKDTAFVCIFFVVWRGWECMWVYLCVHVVKAFIRGGGRGKQNNQLTNQKINPTRIHCPTSMIFKDLQDLKRLRVSVILLVLFNWPEGGENPKPGLQSP